jgi:hypothetical protein
LSKSEDSRSNPFGKAYEGTITQVMPASLKTLWLGALLRQQARYVAPPHDPNIQESVAAHAALIAEDLGKQARAKGVAPKPPPNAKT